MKRVLAFWMLLFVVLATSGCCQSADAESRFLSEARARATKWQSDAALVEVNVASFQLTVISSGVMKSGAPQIFTFHFFSPSTRKGFTVNAMAQGIQGSEDYLPASPYVLPVSNSFQSVADAVDQVRRSFGQSIIVSDADLRVYWNAAGKPDRTAWKIAFVAPRGEQLTRYVDASSGEIVTVEDRSIEPPNEGRTVGKSPASMRFGDLRRSAKANAATRGDGFGLYSIGLMIENSPVFRNRSPSPNNDVEFAWAEFDYARATPTVNWDSLTIQISRLSGLGTEMTTSIDATLLRTPPDVTPETIPPNLLDPEPILRKLREAFPTQGSPGQGVYYWLVSPSRIELPTLPPGGDDQGLATIWLTHQGDPRPLRAEYSPDDQQYAFFTSTAPRGRWLWWTLVKHGRVLTGYSQRISSAPIEYWEQYIYVDAVNGLRSTRCTEPVCYWNCPNPSIPLPPVTCE